MQEHHIVTLNEVKARWALSEIASVRTSVHYQMSLLEDIRSKILEGSTYESLSSQEVERLVHAFERARGDYLSHYFENIAEFELLNWSRAELNDVLTMWEMNNGNLIQLSEYASAAPGTDSENKPSKADPRVVAADMFSTCQPVLNMPPVTVGCYKGMRVLIDGYARSLFFLLAGQHSDRIKVFLPVGMGHSNS